MVLEERRGIYCSLGTNKGEIRKQEGEEEEEEGNNGVGTVGQQIFWKLPSVCQTETHSLLLCPSLPPSACLPFAFAKLTV